MFTFDWGVLLQDIASSLIVAGLTSAVGLIFLEKYLSKLQFSKEMEQMGFKSHGTKKQTQKEIWDMCENSYLIEILYVSGTNYMKHNEQMFRMAMNNGTEIRFLCARPGSEFLKDIEKMEILSGIRESGSSISSEIDEIVSRYSDTDLQIRYFVTEYRLPYIIAYFNDKENNVVKTWLTMTLPPYKSSTSFVLRGYRRDNGGSQDNALDFVEMLEDNFNFIWENAIRRLN